MSAYRRRPPGPLIFMENLVPTMNGINGNFTPLLGACWIVHAQKVALLLEHGADPNQHMPNESPLLRATGSDSIEIMRLLLAYAADMEGRNGQGDTALLVAIQHCDMDNFASVRLLLDHGANINVSNDDGDTPLLVACRRIVRETESSLELVKMLLENGSSVNVENEREVTPLWLTIARSHIFAAEYLLQHGADVDCQRQKMGSPLTWASRHGQLPAVRLLCKYGANVNATDDGRNTALMLAGTAGHAAVVRFLLEHGADAQLCNIQGDQALEIVDRLSLECIYHMVRLRPHTVT